MRARGWWGGRAQTKNLIPTVILFDRRYNRCITEDAELNRHGCHAQRRHRANPLASRVLYGLSSEGQIPAFLARINATMQTPVLATAVTAGLVMLFGWFLPLDDLADLTSRLTLVVFAVVNLSLAWIKRRGDKAPDDTFVAPDWVPWARCISCLALLFGEIGLKSGW